VAVRQGPLRLLVAGHAGPAHRPAGPGRCRRRQPRRSAARQLGRGAGPCGRGSGCGQGGRRRRRPAGRSTDPRGRLRVRQVRPCGARHQRRRPPRAHALRRGGGIPRPPRGRDADVGHLRRPGAGVGGAAGGLRAGGRGRHRLPAAAQGRIGRTDPGVLRRAAGQPRAGPAGRHPAACGTGYRARGARRRRPARPRTARCGRGGAPQPR